MTAAPHPRMHGLTHVCGGPDPIPGICDFISGSGTPGYSDVIQAHPCAVAYWPMNDTAGGAVDVIAAHNLAENPAGTTPGQPVSQQGSHAFTYGMSSPFGAASAIGLDGDAAGFSSLGTCLSVSLATGTAWTVLGWFYLNDANLAALWSFYGGGTGQASVYSAFSPTPNMRYELLGGGGSVTDPAAISVGQWHFSAATWDGVGVIEQFVDGVSVGTDTNTPAADGAGTIRFGCQGTGAGGPSNFLRGRLTQWALFNCVLDAGTIGQLYTLGTAGGGGAADQGQVLTADGAGGTSWADPTIKVDGTGYQEILSGTGITATDNTDGTVTLTATGGDPATATQAWMPLTTVVGGTPDLVWDATDSLIPTLTTL